MDKKKGNRVMLLVCVAIGIIAAIARYGVYTNQKAEPMSDLALANIEALAGGEGGSGYTRISGKCSDPVAYKTWVSCKSGGTEDCSPSDC